MIDLGKMVKARLQSEEGPGIEFQFNPSEYSVSKSATWNTAQVSQGTASGPKPHFVGSTPQTIRLQIFFDDWESNDEAILKNVKLLLVWCSPSKLSMFNQKPQPPVLRFIWGSNPHLMDVRFYLESVSVKYTMFNPGGMPVRATADITLKEVPDEPGPQNPTSGSIHTRRTYLLTEGDTLQSVAAKEYDNPNLWRALAEFNAIDDPLRLTIGARLLLPSPEEAAQASRKER